jgi:hypothetical protein
LSPNDKLNNLNSIDFSNVGNSVAKDSNAFKKIQRFSKITTNNITQDSLSESQVFTKINNLYNNTNTLDNKTYSYGTIRQHNHASVDSFLPSFLTMVDKKGLDKFCEYSLNITKNKISEKVLSRILNIAPIYNNNTEDKFNVNGLSALTMQSFLNSCNLTNNRFDSFFFK